VRLKPIRFTSFLPLLLVALLSPTLSQNQSQSPIQAPPEPPRLHPPQQEQPPSAEDETRVRIEKDMAKKANKERQQQLKRDSDKLFDLATELKAYVDKSNENILSLDVIKKADQIERLARSVKEKMRAE